MITIAAKAENPKQGMTLSELSELLKQAVEAGVPLDSRVQATVGWRGQLTSVTTREDR